jgi:hypothetical protein
VLFLCTEPSYYCGGLLPSDIDQSIARRDGTFLDKNMGSSISHTKGISIANAAWAAWKTLILLLSWRIVFLFFL